jgi:hypothetical protein
VVLLDEADVFLEERTVTDQKQNAVVSGMSMLAHLFPPFNHDYTMLTALQSSSAYSNTTTAS